MQATEPILSQAYPQSDAEKTPHDGSSHSGSHLDRPERPIEASPGVLRIIAIRENMTKPLRWILFLGEWRVLSEEYADSSIGAFLIAYTYGLDGNVRGTMQVSIYSCQRNVQR